MQQQTLLRGEGVESEMRSKLLGLGLGLTLSTLGVVAVPSMAFADASTVLHRLRDSR